MATKTGREIKLEEALLQAVELIEDEVYDEVCWEEKYKSENIIAFQARIRALLQEEKER